MREACQGYGEWPAQIAAGVCAGVDFAIANPKVAKALAPGSPSDRGRSDRYEQLVGGLVNCLRNNAPTEVQVPGSTDEAMLGGIVGMVGDHLRIGRGDRLKDLRPELVLLTLLPYVGFAEAKHWAEQTAAP